jgi:hypothetical protein
VAEAVYTTLRHDVFSLRTHLEGTYVAPGLQAAVLATSAVTTGLRASTPLPTNKLDLHAPNINFRAVVGVQGSPEVLKGWEVGLTQTVLHVDRRFTVKLTALRQVKVRDITTQLGAPANDRNSGIAAPWYNEHVSVGDGQSPLAVTLMDMPGEEYTVQAPTAIDAVKREGTDRFGTWIILWHAATQQARFLGGWKWDVDYGDPAGSRTQVSSFVQLNGRQPPEAVLDGARCADVLVMTNNERRFGGGDRQLFETAARTMKARSDFIQAGQDLTAALDRGETATDPRDALLLAWRNLPDNFKAANMIQLVHLVERFEMKVNGRRPSEAALKDQYQIK